MKHVSIFAIAALAISTSAFAQTAPVAQPVVAVQASLPAVETGWTLPANTELTVAAANELSSKNLKEGDVFAFTVVNDVQLQNQIVIPRGSRGEGKVLWRTGKGMFGKSAKMELAFDWVDVGGQKIPLAGKHRQEGEGNTGATVGAVLAAGLVGGMFVTGKSAVVPQGMQMKAFTKDALPVAPVLVAPATYAVAAPAVAPTYAPAVATPAVVAAPAVLAPAPVTVPAPAYLPVAAPPAVVPAPAVVVPAPAVAPATPVVVAVNPAPAPVALVPAPPVTYAPVSRPVYVSPPAPQPKPAQTRNDGVIIQ